MLEEVEGLARVAWHRDTTEQLLGQAQCRQDGGMGFSPRAQGSGRCRPLCDLALSMLLKAASACETKLIGGTERLYRNLGFVSDVSHNRSA